MIELKDYTDVYVAALFVMAGFFIFLAALGLKRMPDLFCRLHATCKAATIAKIFSFAGATLYFWGSGFVGLKIIIIVAFFFLTSAVGSHLIARAGYKRGVEKCPETWHDDYKDSF